MKRGSKLILSLSITLVLFGAFVCGVLLFQTKDKSPISSNFGQTGLIDKGDKWNIDLEYIPDNSTQQEGTQKIYEYIFTNDSTNTNLVVKLISTPVVDNMTIQYYWSSEPKTDFSDLVLSNVYEDQIVSQVKYIYIIASVSDTTNLGSYSQHVKWQIGKPVALTYDLGNGITSTGYAVAGAVTQSLTAPERSDGADFLGWYTDSEYNTLATFPKVYLSSTTLYAKYFKNNLPVDYLSWNSSSSGYQIVAGSSDLPQDLMIPAMYDGSYITSIGAYAFGTHEELLRITFEEGSQLTTIGDSAFHNCHGLEGITIPASVTTIGTQAFDWCMNLNHLAVEEGNAIFDSRDNCNAIIETSTNTIIQGCGSTVIPDSVTSIAYSAFDGCYALKSIVIPKNITTIGGYAFYYCEELTSVTFESGSQLSSIGYSSFGYCANLQEFVVPAAVSTIGDNAFSYCEAMTAITFEDTTTWYYTAIGSFSGGTQISVTDPELNVTNLVETYYNYNWYRQ